MDPPISNITSHICKENLNLLLRPSRSSGQNRHTHSINPIQKILLCPHRNQFLLFAPGPRITRPIKVLFCNIHESSSFHIFPIILRIGDCTAEFGRRFTDYLRPLLERGTINSVVDTGDGHLWVLKFEDAAGTQGREGGGDDEGGVTKTGEQGTSMNVIETWGIGPFFFCVGDLESAVWRYNTRCVS